MNVPREHRLWEDKFVAAHPLRAFFAVLVILYLVLVGFWAPGHDWFGFLAVGLGLPLYLFSRASRRGHSASGSSGTDFS